MPYDPRQRTSSDIEDEVAGWRGEEQIAATPRHHRPARHLRNTEQAVIAERLARQQAIDEARQSRATNSRRMPGQRSQYTKANSIQRNEEDIDGEYDDVWPPVLPSSAIRHTLPPEGVYQTGNKRLHVEYVNVPPRASAKPQHKPAPQQQTRYTDDIDEEETQLPPRNARRFQIHWLVFVGIALLLMIGGWIAFNDLGVWWQNHQDDVTYGMPRTFQTDAVVGHNDSNSSPSHFIALNLRGQIYVIELPGGDATKARGYFITSEAGNDANPPVKVSFQDIAHSGRLDMVVTIGDPPNPLIVFLFNNGSQFAAKAH